MKSALVLLAASVAVDASRFTDMFGAWNREYGRNYSSQAEYEFRLANFKENVVNIEYLNSIHRGTPNGATFKINHLADRSKAELQARLGFRAPTASMVSSMGPRARAPTGFKAPESLDWRNHQFSVVAPIQDQGNCGSCWAFSAITNVESRVALATNRSLTKLSEQQLVDCDHVCGQYRAFNGCDSGCSGGLQPNAFTYMTQSDVVTDKEYPYTATDNTCKVNKRASGHITGFQLLTEDERELAALVAASGPVAVAVDANFWSFYAGGVMMYLCFGTTFYQLNHAVNIVGYGSEGGYDYWLIRNSWGTAWGESGYAKILRNTGFCGVQLFANTVTLRGE